MSKEWTTTEVQVLIHFRAMGADAVAELLQRSKASVQAQARAQGISLERTGEDIDLKVTPARLLRYVARSSSLSLCPMCGKRLAMMTSTGICRVCHLDRLIELRTEQLEVLARERRLSKLRQDKKRMRVCQNCSEVFFPRAKSDKQLCGRCSDGS